MAKKQEINEREELLKALDETGGASGDDETGEKRSGDEQQEDQESDEGTEGSESGSGEEAKEKVKKGGKKKNEKAAQAKKGPQKPPSTAPGNGGISKPGDGSQSSKRKKTALILSLIGVVLVGLAVAGYFYFGTSDTNDNNTVNVAPAISDDSKLVPRRIDGVLDKPENQNKFPIAIMVENQIDSRPQSGLDKANIVYEALAEGGITRFLTLYTFAGPVKEIGPVRSARPYYVDWARSYDPLYAHIGGSPKSLSRISQTGIRDFNQFFNSQYFWRDKTREVAVEHTLFTSDYLMTIALLDKKLPTEGSYEPWKYKNDAPSSERPASQHITVNFSTFSYKVDYEYDPVTNEYARSLAEKPHVMRDGAQIRPKNVVVITVNRRLEQPVAGNHGRLEMDTVGQGNAQFFYDGVLQKGIWKKGSPQEPLQLLTQDGVPVLLNAGQTWVEVVPPDQQVTVK